MNSNNKEIKENRELSIHLWNFPDTIYFLIKEDMRKLYFNKIYSFYGSKRKAAKNLGISLAAIRHYEDAFSMARNIKYRQYIPVNFLKKTIHILDLPFIKKLEKI
ncbi:MAG: hypothetical protein IH934_02175 [Nanoarchaeota archaeon]|nr:hypothetical protein [Nanoarchaeota archaeon]